MASIKINKTKLSVSCFMANLKGFLRNHKQFTNEISFQQSRTSVFFFFSTPGRLFGSKNERRTHFLRACPVKIKYCFGCVPEETLQTTEKLSPFAEKIGRRFCTKPVI